MDIDFIQSIKLAIKSFYCRYLYIENLNMALFFISFYINLFCPIFRVESFIIRNYSRYADITMFDKIVPDTQAKKFDYWPGVKQQKSKLFHP